MNYIKKHSSKEYPDSQNEFFTPSPTILSLKNTTSIKVDEQFSQISPFKLGSIQQANYDLEDDNRRISKVSFKKRISIVNSNGIDMTEIFQFGQRQTGTSKPMRRLSISQRITKLFGVPLVEDFYGDNLFENFPPYIAFLILASSVILNTMITPLFISIPEITWSRNAWRFLFQALILGPFVLYEKRTGNQEVQNCYKWSHAFNPNNIRTLFFSSINTSLTTTLFIVLSKYNYIATNCLLGGMINFWLSVVRSLNNEKRHGIEFCGQIMCVVGIGIITFDSYTLSVDHIPPKVLTTYSFNQHFFISSSERIILGILVPILVSIVSTQLSIYTLELKYLYPPFLQLFLISIFTSLFLQSVGYFMYCTTIDGQHFEGWFGFIFDGAFTKFMYIAVVFNFGIFFTQVLIAQLYEPIIPACTALMEPPFTALFLDLWGQQYMPSAFASIGYIMIIPGQFVVILGQYLLEQQTKTSQRLSPTERITIRNIRVTKGPILNTSLHLIQEEQEAHTPHQ